MIFEAPLMKRLYGSGLGTSLKQAEPISPDEKTMLWSSQQFGTHETSRNNNIQLSNTFQLCLCTCTYSICLYYYYNYDDIQIQSACIIIIIMMTFRFNLLVL